MLTVVLSTFAEAVASAQYQYSSPEKSWDEALGNHRALLSVPKDATVAELAFQWRRNDNDVANRQFIIINPTTGHQVENIDRVVVNNEQCLLRFGPVVKGEYCFYYLPYQVQTEHGYYGLDYLKPEKRASAGWLRDAAKQRRRVEATVLRVESRTEFDSFYPMEIAATADEVAAYADQNGNRPFLVFTEDRSLPVRMRHNIPVKWLSVVQGAPFEGKAAPNEYYAFQAALFANNNDTGNLKWNITDLVSDNNKIAASSVTCFNTEGVDPYGVAFTKQISVKRGDVQPLWFGVDIAADTPAGRYVGSLTVGDSNFEVAIPIVIEVSGEPIEERGDNEPWRHSRLRWLNSTLGITPTPTAQYDPVQIDGNDISVTGRTVQFDNNNPLPRSIDSWGNELLHSPMRFVVVANGEPLTIELNQTDSQSSEGRVVRTFGASNETLSVECTSTVEYDGWLNFRYTITPSAQIAIDDIRIETDINNDVAEMFMGFGLHGQRCPELFEASWDKIINKVGGEKWSKPLMLGERNERLAPFDSFWIGNADAGLHCELRGTTYSGPLLNLYHPACPDTWYNGGKGGFRLERGDECVKTVVYSGSRTLSSPLTAEWSLIVTPVKKLDLRSQFDNRYYHNGSNPVPTISDIESGVKVINVHHANFVNPYINYPFLTIDRIREFADQWHANGCKVKIYYTLRELSNAFPELWAVRSMGTEILRGGKGGGYPWLREHVVEDYSPQWYAHFEFEDPCHITADASMLTAESDSRWYNYYVEGLAWIVKHGDIDGLYLDDVSFDRRILQRMRHAMESIKQGCIIDLHSNTGFSRGPALQYTEFFPYVDKLWFGESFLYDNMSPECWLTECSGIPFGLMGDMLQNGGNKWLGMQYGMTVRHPWKTEGVVCDPRIVWRVLDRFGIRDATMTGYWENGAAVVSSDEDVKVTVYQNGDRLLLSVGNYSDHTKQVTLSFDWQKLGIDPEGVVIEAEEMDSFQSAARWSVDQPFKVEPRRGWLLTVGKPN